MTGRAAAAAVSIALHVAALAAFAALRPALEAAPQRAVNVALVSLEPEAAEPSPPPPAPRRAEAAP
ncbi:MAG: hypothetical protein ACK4YQ_14500, partial [Phenylobacterium sp.]